MTAVNESSTSLLLKGLDLARDGHYDRAIHALKAASQISPQKPETHYGLGLLYLLTGDRDSAVRECETLNSIDTDLADKLVERLNI